MSEVHYHGFLLDENRRRHAIQAITMAPDGAEIIVQEPKRTSKMNALMWVVLAQMEEKCKWHGIKLSSYEWKDLASSQIVRHKTVPNLDGTGFIVLGQPTKNMSNRLIKQIVEILCAIAGDQGVEIVITENIDMGGCA